MQDQAGNAKIELERLTNYYNGYSNRDLVILLFITLESLIYILPLTVWVYLIKIFLVRSIKRFFSTKMRFGRSRSSKVIDFARNRKRIYDFLLVRNAVVTFGDILHRVGDIADFCDRDLTPIPP